MYQEQAGSGAFMVPLIVRAEPETAFQALISLQSLWADPPAPKTSRAGPGSKGLRSGLLQPPGFFSRLVRFALLQIEQMVMLLQS